MKRDPGNHAPRHHLLTCAGKMDDAMETLPEGRDFEGARRAALGAISIGGAFAAFRVGAFFVVNGYPRIPNLANGVPYPNIGLSDVQFGDRATFRARVFYPASTSAGPVAPYLHDGVRTSAGMARLVRFPAFLLQHLAAASSGCTADAPVSTDPARAGFDNGFPVLVYSHGMGGNADMGSYLFRHMASLGIVVVAVEHTDGSASRTETIDENGDSKTLLFGCFPEKTRAQRLIIRARELLEVHKVITSPVGPSMLEDGWQRAIDTSSVFVGGHSYGGPAALVAAVARSNPTFQGCILHDPAWSPMDSAAIKADIKVPVLQVMGDQYVRIKSLMQQAQYVNNNAVRGSGVYHLKGASHGNFVDAALWAPLFIMQTLGAIGIPAAGPLDPTDAHIELARSALTFVKQSQITKDSDEMSVNGVQVSLITSPRLEQVL